MMIKKAYAIYFSPTGTTEKAITAFTAGVGVPFEKYDLTTLGARQGFHVTFGKEDLVVVGLPVYGGRLPENIEDFFTGLKGDGTPAVALVMYGNRSYDGAMAELKERLEERGFEVKGGAAFVGQHTFNERIATGRPDENDLRIADDFGKQTIKTIENKVTGTLIIEAPPVEKQDQPKPSPIAAYAIIETTDDCKKCGLCAKNCPWGAIDAGDFSKINYEKCVHCFRCMKYCPVQAKVITNEQFAALVKKFEERLNIKRCEPELVLPKSE